MSAGAPTTYTYTQPSLFCSALKRSTSSTPIQSSHCTDPETEAQEGKGSSPHTPSLQAGSEGCRGTGGGDHTGGECGVGSVSGKVTMSFRRAGLTFVHCGISGAQNTAHVTCAISMLDREMRQWGLGSPFRPTELGKLYCIRVGPGTLDVGLG